MKQTEYNEVLVDENDLVNLMLQGTIPTKVITTDMQALEQYNHFCNLFMIDGIDTDTPAESNDKYSYKFVENWYMPDRYREMDLFFYLNEKCETADQYVRLVDEWEEYDSRGLVPLLRYCVYLVDTMRENDIVWGVGRGSSVASYILYLIGVHKIDSIKYDLDFKEFFR